MTVMGEVPDAASNRSAFKRDFEQRLKELLGVRIEVAPVDRGALDGYIGTSQTSKIKPLLDGRK